MLWHFKNFNDLSVISNLKNQIKFASHKCRSNMFCVKHYQKYVVGVVVVVGALALDLFSHHKDRMLKHIHENV